MTEEEKKITREKKRREKHTERISQGHKLTALMKKRKEEILHNKGQSTVQPTVQSLVQSSVQSTIQSNDAYVYGVGILASLVIGVCVFLHIMLPRLKIKKPSMKNKINQQNDVICFKKIYNKWLVLIGKKSIADSVKDRLIIKATATRIFHILKAANVKPPKASLDAMDIMKLAGGIVGGVLVKDYAVYKKWIKE